MLKSRKTVDLKELVQKELSSRTEVRPFPAAVTRLVAACQSADATSESLAKIIECDAALALRLLRMANSPLYGLSSEVQSVEHAASILGMRSIKRLATTVAGATMFSEGETAEKERADLYMHSLAVGAVARVLAESDPDVTADDVFMACIFHDIGKLFLFDIVPEAYAEINQNYVGTDLTDQEQLVFGTTHEEIGLNSAHSWNLAENIKMAIGYHHHPANSLAHNNLTTIVHVADQLAKAWGLGTGQKYELDVADSIVGQIADEATLAVIRERAEELMADAEVCV